MRTMPAPGIETLIIKGIEDRLSKYFGINKTYFVSTSDRMARMRVLTTQKDIKFPIAFVVLGSGTIDPTYNSGSMRRHGTYTGVSASGDALGRSYLLPVLMTFQVTLVTDTFATALKFFKLWLLGGRANSLNFDVTYDNLPISIKADLDTTVTIPTRDTSADTSNNYEFEASMNVHGYVSPDDIQEVATLKSFNTSVAILTPVDKVADAEHDPYIPAEPSVVPDDPTLLDSSGEHHKDYVDISDNKRYKVHDREDIDGDDRNHGSGNG